MNTDRYVDESLNEVLRTLIKEVIEPYTTERGYHESEQLERFEVKRSVIDIRTG